MATNNVTFPFFTFYYMINDNKHTTLQHVSVSKKGITVVPIIQLCLPRIAQILYTLPRRFIFLLSNSSLQHSFSMLKLFTLFAPLEVRLVHKFLGWVRCFSLPMYNCEFYIFFMVCYLFSFLYVLYFWHNTYIGP